MFKRMIAMILLLVLLGTSLCFAEEVIYTRSTGYTMTLLNAKTVNEADEIIKAKIKEQYGDAKDYKVVTWLIERKTRKVVETSVDYYDENGKFKSTMNFEVAVNPPGDSLDKIIRYIDREGK